MNTDTRKSKTQMGENLVSTKQNKQKFTKTFNALWKSLTLNPDSSYAKSPNSGHGHVTPTHSAALQKLLMPRYKLYELEKAGHKHRAAPSHRPADDCRGTKESRPST